MDLTKLTFAILLLSTIILNVESHHKHKHKKKYERKLTVKTSIGLFAVVQEWSWEKEYVGLQVYHMLNRPLDL